MGIVYLFRLFDRDLALPYRLRNSLSFQLSIFGRLGLVKVVWLCMVASSPDTAEAHMEG
jgi:hypothetical protein